MTAAAPRKPRSLRRRLLFVLVALLVGLLLAAALVEIGFRLFWRLPPHFAEFGQAGMYVAAADGHPLLAPGYRGTLQLGDAPANAVHVNALGLRGAPVPPRRPGQRRILVLGDSVVFGFGVEDDEALPARLQHALGERGVDAAVGNGGVISFGCSHAVEHMAHLDGPFDADAFVLCGFLGNDPMDEVAPERLVYAGLLHQNRMARLLASGSWRTRLAVRWRAALWFENWVFVNDPASSPLAAVPADPEIDARALGVPPQKHASLFLDHRDLDHVFVAGTEPVIARLLGYTRAALQRARRIAGDRPLVFVILPTSWHTNESKRLEMMKVWQWQPADYPAGTLQRRWLDVAAEVGVPAFDATPVLTAAGDSKDLFVNDGGHLSARGNDVVATWLAEQAGELLK